MQFPFNPNTNSRQPNLGVYFAPLSASSPYAADPRRGDLHSALSPLYASENPQFRSRQRRPRRALEPLSGGRRAQRRFLNSILASDREDNDDGFMSASEAELDEEDLQVAAPTWHSHFTQAGEGFFRPSAQEPPKQSGPSLRERVKARQERKLRMWQAKQRAAEEEKSAARALEVAIEGAAVETKRAEAKEEGSVAHSVSETSPSVSRALADEWNLVSSGGELLSESEAESRVKPERSRPTPPRKHVSRLVDPEAARRIAAQRPPQISAEDSAFLKEVAEQWYCRMDRRIRGNLRRLEDPTLLQSLEGLVHSYKSMAACPHEAVGLARSEFGRDGCSHSVNVCLPHDPLFKRKRGASFDSDFLVIDSDSEDEEQVLKFDVIAHDDAEWQEWSRANRCSCRVESGPTASAALLWPPAPLYLAIEDSWARMLLHGLCQFHGLISKSFTSRTGLRLTCVHHPRGLQQSGLTVAAEANAWPAHLPVPKLVSHLETRRQQRF